MAIVVPSRFSLLKIVEDDFLPPKPKENTKAKKVDNKKKVEEKKVKPTKNNKQNNKNGTKKKATPVVTNEQNEDKTKYTNSADDKFEEELQQALMLSKLESEKHSFNNDNSESNDEQFQLSSSNKKQKKKMINTSDTISFIHDKLDGNFNDSAEEKHYIDEKNVKKRLKNDVDNNKNHTCSAKREPPSNEEIKGSLLQVILDDKEKEISDLKLEIVDLKAELLLVKSRNKQLCNIIGQGEMQDKAQVLAEVERLRDIHEELNREVASLHAQLEQERSKGSTSKVDMKVKDKKKRMPSE